MQYQKNKVWYLLLLLGMFSCGKDVINDESWTVTDEPNIIVESARLVTSITDENGTPVDGLTAAFNDTIRLVNKGDIFQFKGSGLNKRGEVLTVTDQVGNKFYFTQNPIANDVAYFHQAVIRNMTIVSHNSHLPIQLPIAVNLGLAIAANQYKKSLQPYSGDLLMAYFAYDLSNENHRAALPGGNTGFMKDGSRKLLNKKAAFNFRVTTPNAENLDVVSALFSSSLLNEETYLFYYNETVHHWEQVSDDFSNNNEIAIHKSGHYCLAQASAYINLSGSLLRDGVALPNQKIDIFYNNTIHTFYTSNEGRWEAAVPAGIGVSYRYDLECFGQSIAVKPSNIDVDLPPDSPSAVMQTSHFKGNILNCEGRAMSNGFLQLKGQNLDKVLFIEQGSFDFILPHCSSNEISARVFDAESGEIGEWVEWSSGVQNQFYNLFACSKLKGFFLEVHSMDASASYTALEQKLIGDRLELKAKDELNADNVFTITFPIGQSGLQAPDRVNLVWKDNNYAGKGIAVNCSYSNSCGFESLDITQLSEQAGGWVRARFKAKLWAKINATLQAGYVNVEGSFQFKRQF